MNKLSKYFIILCIGALTFSCNDLDIPPISIVGDEQMFSSDQSVSFYMAKMYNDLPLFALGGVGNVNGGYNSDNQIGMMTGKNAWNIGGGQVGWWNYTVIRNANYFLETMPTYKAKFPEVKFNAYMGEAYWLRAFYYFQMVKRYGGVPYINRTLNYPEESIDELTYPREKEEVCYENILKDLDEAIKLLPEESLTDYGLARGRANKYVAYTLKARVALYAASIAKYGEKQAPNGKNEAYTAGAIGIPAARAADWFKQAYDAADAVVKSGKYELYNPGGDKAANFTSIFTVDNVGKMKESIFQVEWALGHANNWDGNNVPYQFRPAYSSDSQPYFEMIQYFEDVDGNPLADVLDFGTIENPKYYDSPLDAFAMAEPRVKGSVIFPMAEYGGAEIEIRKGIITSGGSLSEIETGGEHFRVGSGTPESATYEGPDGTKMPVQGKSGIGVVNGCYTGFYALKWLDPIRPNAQDWPNGCLTPWIEMRYAEVLLTRAEAAIELGQHQAEAEADINALRERAGSNKRYSGNLTLADVRKERTIELFFEDKTYWDLRRWRTAATEMLGGMRHVVWPIYDWDKKQYFMYVTEDRRVNYSAYNPLWYYNPIPGDAMNKNAKIIPNPSN